MTTNSAAIKQNILLTIYKIDSRTNSHWLTVAILVATVAGALGGLGLFASSNSLPNFLTTAIEKIGRSGCLSSFAIGGLFVVLGGTKGVIKLVKAYFGTIRKSPSPDKVFLRSSTRVETPAGTISRRVTFNNVEESSEENASSCDSDVSSLSSAEDEENIPHDLRISTNIVVALALEKKENEGDLLLAAVRDEKLEEVQELLKKPNIKDFLNKKDKEGQTALHLAIRISESKKILGALLEAGADPNLFDNEGQTPLHAAALAVTLEWAVDLLLQYNADRDIRDNEGNPPLQIAAEHAPELIDKLATEKNLKKKNQLLRTPLHSALARSTEDGVQRLLKQKSLQLNLPDAEGNTPLHQAVLLKRFPSLQILLGDSRVNVGAVNKEGKTAIDIALEKNFTRAFGALLPHHLKKVTNAKSELLRLWGLAFEKEDIRAIIEKHESFDSNYQDEEGNTELHKAVQQQDAQ